MRVVLAGLPSRFHFHQNRFHLVFLRGRYQPADGALQLLLVFLHISIVFCKDQLFVPLLTEKGPQVGTKAFKYIDQRGNGGRRQISFQQRDKSLGKLAAVSQLFLSQSSLKPQSADLFSDLHAYHSFETPICVYCY